MVHINYIRHGSSEDKNRSVVWAAVEDKDNVEWNQKESEANPTNVKQMN